MAPKRVAVVGGGVTGLTAAYRLLQTSNGTPVDVTVFEASATLGGKLRTGELAGIPLEDGADSFVVRKPWAIDLCRELGLGEELVAPVPGGAHVWARGRLVPFPKAAAFGIPSTAEDILRWPGLSPRGRFRAMGDLLKPARKDGGDESIRSLAARRLGPEAADVLVGPLLAGIHAGDPTRLGVAATFPELRTWERGHGSLIRGSKAAARAAREALDPVPLFATLWTGLSRLPEVLATALGPDRIRTGEPVSAVERRTDGWVVRVSGGPVAADAVVLATPAFESARLLGPADADAARELDAIPYASTAVVSLVYPADTAGRLPPGTGVIVPAGPDRRWALTACTWVSSKWPREEHEGRAVLRCFVGRHGEQEALDLGDDDLIDRVAEDVERITPLRVAPASARVVRWPRSMPQYEVGHLDRMARIESALAASPGVFLAGSAYRGVGIADCVRQGREVAERVRLYLAPPGTVRPERSASAGNRTNVDQEAIT